MISPDVLSAESGCAWFGFECLAVLLVGYSEVQFELGPRFVRGRLAFPDFAIIGEYAGAENELVGDSGDASLAVRLAAMREKGCVSWVVTND
mgnify:CR=1 FL=1